MGLPRFALVSLATAAALVAMVVLWTATVEPVDAPGRLLAVLAPERVVAGERFVVFAGVSTSMPARLHVRLCDERLRCAFERDEPYSAGTTFKWVAAATVPPGVYALEAFLQVPTPFGHRSVASFRGQVDAR